MFWGCEIPDRTQTDRPSVYNIHILPHWWIRIMSSSVHYNRSLWLVIHYALRNNTVGPMFWWFVVIALLKCTFQRNRIKFCPKRIQVGNFVLATFICLIHLFLKTDITISRYNYKSVLVGMVELLHFPLGACNTQYWSGEVTAQLRLIFVVM